MVRDMARDFARNELAPHAADWDRDASFPVDAVRQMGELGLMGMLVDADSGGASADYVSYAMALEEIAAGDGATSTIMAVQNSPSCSIMNDSGSDAQRARYLAPMASGEMLTAFCLTEPHTGSDAGAITTRAERTDNGYRINGVKQFITSGSHARMAYVFAVTDPDQGSRGISCFLVPTEDPGYQVVSVESKLGQRASDTCQIALENVEVGEDMRIGAEGDGYRIALANLESGRIGIAAQAVGLAQAAFNAAWEYAGERKSFGKAIVDHQAVGFRLANMQTEIDAGRAMYLRAAALRDADEPCLMEACQAKLFASEMAERVCSDAIQVHGGYGYLNDYPVERIYRDVRVCQIYEGTSDVQKMVIQRELSKRAELG